MAKQSWWSRLINGPAVEEKPTFTTRPLHTPPPGRTAPPKPTYDEAVRETVQGDSAARDRLRAAAEQYRIDNGTSRTRPISKEAQPTASKRPTVNDRGLTGRSTTASSSDPSPVANPALWPLFYGQPAGSSRNEDVRHNPTTTHDNNGPSNQSPTPTYDKGYEPPTHHSPAPSHSYTPDPTPSYSPPSYSPPDTSSSFSSSSDFGSF